MCISVVRTICKNTSMRRNNRQILESPLKLIAIGCFLLLVAAGTLAIFQRHALFAELEQESTILHRLASQRVEQHDAHLTALSAIAVAAQGERRDLFLDVATAIKRFYPRIDEVQLVSLDPNAETIGTEPLDPATANLVRSAAKAFDGRIALLGIRFRNGGDQDVRIAARINPGNCARAVDLKGGRRDIWAIDFVYEETSIRLRRAVVRVFAE